MRRTGNVRILARAVVHDLHQRRLRLRANPSRSPSPMRRYTSSACVRIAVSRSPSNALRRMPWPASHFTRFGACSTPTIGTSSGFSIWLFARDSASVRMPSMIAGVISGPSTSASISVRLSRTNSRSSFIRMVRIECIDFMRAGPLPIRSVARRHPRGSTRRSARAIRPPCLARRRARARSRRCDRTARRPPA